MTRDESRRAHGEDATIGDVWVMTGGGMRLQRSIARVNPSTMDKGSSVPSDMDGRTGMYSTIACAAMYNPGETPENMKDGRIPSRGPMIASPPNTIVSNAHASLTKDLSSGLFSPAVRRCLAYKVSLICLKAMQSRNTATRSREQTLVPNQVNGAIGSTAYRYRDMNGWRDMVARERKRESGSLAHQKR